MQKLTGKYKKITAIKRVNENNTFSIKVTQESFLKFPRIYDFIDTLSGYIYKIFLNGNLLSKNNHELSKLNKENMDLKAENSMLKKITVHYLEK
ncbi:MULTISPECIES: hypothetical protein [Pelosinus]|jgi:hypothetical protein|uniref:Uncharacterized protein n=1 Tax=Pelosinus fermentans B4 TaxID=1149862 RepID=I8RN39_9FIRM|nr:MULTISPECIES: hypothetical protein [Pelosinus]EIW20400.1 hypothetical protein FB4_2364 [Pelosinus fermentans B4]EIW25541.1 hypothetical protein FA11_2163 [Pelosinus fermentans A11]OAM93263.1 hypothetical protein FR7_01279 [Pelosinus fermentans DSM 17108]SDQ72072.1 hypothetical protein SAMN04515679_1343 [Pelosinus fermentans]